MIVVVETRPMPSDKFVRKMISFFGQGDAMYILEDGECKAYIQGEKGEIEVKHYTRQGEYFGEIALIQECERKRTRPRMRT